MFYTRELVTNLFSTRELITNLFSTRELITNLFSTRELITNLFSTRELITNLFSTRERRISQTASTPIIEVTEDSSNETSNSTENLPDIKVVRIIEFF